MNDETATKLVDTLVCIMDSLDDINETLKKMHFTQNQ